MNTPASAREQGLDPHYKVRVVLPGAVLHLASRDEPRPGIVVGGEPGWSADCITGYGYGDTIGYIDWTAVSAITWRWTRT